MEEIQQRRHRETRPEAPRIHRNLDPWTLEEDQLLLFLASEHANRDANRSPPWTKISRELHKAGYPLRPSKRVRERWLEKVSPAVNKSKFTLEESIAVCVMYSEWRQRQMEVQQLQAGGADGLGSSGVRGRPGRCVLWAEVGRQLGRTETQVKNHFNALKRRNDRIYQMCVASELTDHADSDMQMQSTDSDNTHTPPTGSTETLADAYQAASAFAEEC